MTYSPYPSGSEWRRWDLHIHTPETKKEDRFQGRTPDEKWNQYIADINASSEEISAIGITDYLSLDNYFKFKNFVADGSITKKFNLILPNIELRVVPVTGSAKPINLHCIFNPKIDSELETRFLGKLKFRHGQTGYSAHPSELRRLGRNFVQDQTLDDQAALRKGIEQCVIEMGTLYEIFENDSNLRDNCVIALSNKSTDGVSGIVQHSDFFTAGGSQLDGTRQAIYQFADAIFSSNENDIHYFTGRGIDKPELVITKCRNLMPCFHGCDAHVNSKIFKPDENRFCWIKADPTFEGLKQTIYEPEDRVKIQAYKPDIKNDRYIISELRVSDQNGLFGSQNIKLNENLNAIIGGKSSGKSLLLYSTANSIDPRQVTRLSQRLRFDGYDLGSPFDFEVVWKNGEVDKLNDPDESAKTRKITFIPQLYIHYLVEKNNKDDLNDLIESILLQDGDFKEYYEEKKIEIQRTATEIGAQINSYLLIRSQALRVQNDSIQLGKSPSIQKGIETLQQTIAAGQKASNLSPEEFSAYESLTAQKTKATLEMQSIVLQQDTLDQIKNELEDTKVDLLGGTDELDGIPLRGKVDRLLDNFNVVPEEINTIIQGLKEDFQSLQANFSAEMAALALEGQKNIKISQIGQIDALLKPYLEKIAGQEELKKFASQLVAEQQKLQQALKFEKQLRTLSEDYKNVRAKIASLLRVRFEHYKSIVTKVNESRRDIGTGILLDCKLMFPSTDFPLFEQVNKAAITDSSIFHLIFSNNLVMYEEVIKLFADQLRESEGKLYNRDGSISLPLKNRTSLEDVLRGMIQDHFKLDFTVTYKGDDLLKMSPGKKGTVLLILFLQISTAEFPILIDQPEDNLDNRTIYELLCQMIKTKKKQRQIIIVSHNANLVIATDSENIIVANQEGQESNTTRNDKRFGYVNGSLEHSFAKLPNETHILNQQGIREHACDILEGGDEAFKQRERKYSIR